ncbi:MAG: Bis(5'-nucleosyl)-tetraphosphatase PrpE (asymmetrical) [Pelotomaculum sp. PtaB.Bin013]|uniref:AAA family ATPase n=1 Tax=Pelotomaculum isophthalicicum JI TaxID=947010 RepID=A0A9X4JTW6_9FIRM|nr:AAA family ATPase [Pelotomaculum isophthalicicum]MDF9408080.1 AAA family ATPase [Pelotomaculum isophthalicicum JI]OPX92286.1 MAG: Bis(5'-nucleosyl)-tetraphosphatase PrpE (asymmetrical) [Pelotomaculum sp. PtaB.Bin013]
MAGISLPGTTLLVLCGTPGCGKSTFASRYFRETMIVSSDQCRFLVSDSETNMAASREAFKLFRFTIERRLSLGRFTVADSTAITRQSRGELLRIGRKYGFNITLLIFNIPEDVCLARNAGRERRVVRSVIAKMRQMLQRTLRDAHNEGFDNVYIITEGDLNNPAFRINIRNYEVTLPGPFDIIGDIHGCFDELTMLLDKLGYRNRSNHYAHPACRKAVFLGDLTDRGPRGLDSFWLVKAMVDSGNALYIPGNHCRKLSRYLEGRNVKIAHGMEKTVAEIEALTEDEREFFREEFLKLYREAPPYLILDKGKLVVSHGGIKEDMIGKVSGRIRNFCFFGDATGEITEAGLPVRRDWAQSYRGDALIVYGHSPVPEAVFVNNTIDIDQGCVMGGKLTALRYPELEITQVPAMAAYYERTGFSKNTFTHDDMCYIADSQQ